MTKPVTKTLPMNGGHAKMTCTQIGPVFVKKYEGFFLVESLQDMADTGMWYTGIQGLPEAVEGNGSTPEYAIRDALSRNRELINKLNVVVSTLQKALENVIE